MHEQVHIYIHVYNMYVHTYFSILRHDIAADTISLPEWSAGPYKIPLNNFPRTVKACSVLGAAVPLACDLHFAGDSRRGISYAEPSEGMSFFSLPLSPSPGQGRSSCVPRAGRGQQDATRCRIPLGRRRPPPPPLPALFARSLLQWGGGVLLPFLWHHGWARGHATCGTELQRHLERQMRHATRASKVIRMEEGVRPRQARARNCVVTIPT